MVKLVFLVEERSMADLLEHLLPRLFPEIQFQCIPHEGSAIWRRAEKAPGLA